MIDQTDLQLLMATDDLEAAVQYIQRHGARDLGDKAGAALRSLPSSV
jgi:hypothetical protein